MSAPDEVFYEPIGDGRYRSTAATTGPWSTEAQHGGPPGALLARAIESIDEGVPRVVGRFTLDLLGPVPVDDLTVTASVVRPGRTVSLRQAELARADARVVARAQAWTFPEGEGPGGGGDPLPHGPADGREEDFPPGWTRGYLDSIEWRWVEGSMAQMGPATVWMRPRIPLVPGEQLSPLQRLLCCVDSASGAANVLDPVEWSFMNTDVTVHLVRPPVGEWVCLRAQTTLSGGSVATATSEVYDEQGVVARSAQALLLVRR